MKFRTTMTVVGLLCIASAPVLLQANPGSVKADVLAESVGNMLLVENDIFVGRANSGGPLQRGLSISSALSLWPDGIVPFEIASDVSDQGRAIVSEAIAHWNERSSILLVDRSESSDNSNDFVRFITGPGCASWVGRQGGAQEIWVSDYCTSGSMIHEVGHALGLLHEHTRADRDQFINVQWANIQADKAFNFEVGISGVTDLGPYDYGSVMHYGEYFFSKNGEKTLQPINEVGDVVIGQRVQASRGDLDAIDRLYQTDLGIDVAYAGSGSQAEVTLTVSNLGNQGANGLVISVTGVGDVTEFSGVAGWQCFAGSNELTCTLDRLSSAANASVTLAVSSEVAASDIAVSLRSKTFDYNLANNSGLDSDDDLVIASALGDDRVALPASISSGSTDGWLLALFLLLLLYRRTTVIAFVQSVHSEPHRESTGYAYSCTTTPPSGAPR